MERDVINQGGGGGTDLEKEVEMPPSPPSLVVDQAEGEGVVKEAEVLVVGDSPEKPNNLWLDALELYMMDRSVLESKTGWLNDNIVRAAQTLLSKQSQGKIAGWQHTQCSNMNTGFAALPPNSTYAQILHVSRCHWILVTNVNPNNGVRFRNSVGIYDSNRMLSVPKALKMEICSFIRPTCDRFSFDIINSQAQQNGSDCGLYAIACATELVHGAEPVLCHWDIPQMRPHLIQCLTEGTMNRFPAIKKRRVGSLRVRKSLSEYIYCLCRLPNDKSRPMIECTSCKKWYHNDCAKVVGDIDVKWRCNKCLEALA